MLLWIGNKRGTMWCLLLWIKNNIHTLRIKSEMTQGWGVNQEIADQVYNYAGTLNNRRYVQLVVIPAPEPESKLDEYQHQRLQIQVYKNAGNTEQQMLSYVQLVVIPALSRNLNLVNINIKDCRSSLQGCETLNNRRCVTFNWSSFRRWAGI